MPSQLTQLKSALSKAGINQHLGNKNKKRKRDNLSQDNDREKKAARLNEIHRKLNPFDLKVTKLKHDVIGRKIKGMSGQPAKSKQAGLEQANFSRVSHLTPFISISAFLFRERKRFSKSLNKKITLVDSLIVASEKMIPPCPSKSACCSDLRKRGKETLVEERCLIWRTRMN
jgi:hypothetical protein